MDALLGNLDLWGTAILNTILLFLGGGVLALVIGTIVGAMRVSPVPIARGVGTVYVNLIRNTPLTLVFFFFVFGYPKLDLPDIPFLLLGDPRPGHLHRDLRRRGAARRHQHRAGRADVRPPGRSG